MYIGVVVFLGLQDFISARQISSGVVEPNTLGSREYFFIKDDYGPISR